MPRKAEDTRGETSPHTEAGSPDQAVLDAALRLLSVRARSVGELRDRLLKKDLEPGEVGRCIQWLKARGYLDDRQFAAALTRDRLRFSPRSPFLVQRELREKKVGSSVAETVVREVMDEEGLTPADLAKTAADGWVRKQSTRVRSELIGERFSPEREKARRRLYGFLARRGFIGEAAQAGLEAGEEKARDMED